MEEKRSEVDGGAKTKRQMYLEGTINSDQVFQTRLPVSLVELLAIREKRESSPTHRVRGSQPSIHYVRQT